MHSRSYQYRDAMQERLAGEEWLAVAMSMLGTIGLGVSSEDPPQEGKTGAPLGTPRVLSLGAFLLLLGSALVYGRRLTSPAGRKSAAGISTAASVYGLQVFQPASLHKQDIARITALQNALLLFRGWTCMPSPAGPFPFVLASDVFTTVRRGTIGNYNLQR